MANEKTIFTTCSLGVDENGDERFLYTGLSAQTRPIPRKDDNDVMLLIDTGEFFYSAGRVWTASKPK